MHVKVADVSAKPLVEYSNQFSAAAGLFFIGASLRKLG
jgi:hypothetical protein